MATGARLAIVVLYFLVGLLGICVLRMRGNSHGYDDPSGDLLYKIQQYDEDMERMRITVKANEARWSSGFRKLCEEGKHELQAPALNQPRPRPPLFQFRSDVTAGVQEYDGAC